MRPPSPLRRFGTGGLALVLAASLYGCSSGEPGDPSEPAASTASAEQDGPAQADSGEDTGNGRAGEGPGSGKDAAGEDSTGKDPAAGDAGKDTGKDAAAKDRVAPPAEPGRPAVVEDTGTGEERRATVKTVALDKPARPAEGLEITVSSTKPVDAEGMGPGGVSGPAIAVVVTVRNTTDAAVSTLGSTVTVAYGRDKVPASPSRQPGDDPLPREVAPGKTVSGTYTFLVPEDQRDDVVVTASYRATDPAAVFAGPARGDGADR
ncbi:hypothetical protein ACH9EU_18285 [Kocuria sp. M1R5S2]|uniref:hypothetical protein n=1 Tax=Kocuria rhizosphaerae TaxID=3376285 RepID=UPI00379D518D